MPTDTEKTSTFEQRKKALSKLLEGMACVLRPPAAGAKSRHSNANEIMRVLASIQNEDPKLGFIAAVLRQGDFKTAWDKAMTDLGSDATVAKELSTYVIRKIITGDNVERQFELFVRHKKGGEAAAESIVKFLSKAYFGDAAKREATLLRTLDDLKMTEIKAAVPLQLTIDDIAENYKSTVGSDLRDDLKFNALVQALSFPRCSRRLAPVVNKISMMKSYDEAIEELVKIDEEQDKSRRPLRYELSDAELRETSDVLAPPMPIAAATPTKGSDKDPPKTRYDDDHARARVAGDRPSTGNRDPDAPCNRHSQKDQPASHTNRECRLQQREAQARQREAQPPPNSGCWKCGSQDHFKRDCPHRDSDKNPPATAPSIAPAPARDARVGGIIEEQNDWYDAYGQGNFYHGAAVDEAIVHEAPAGDDSHTTLQLWPGGPPIRGRAAIGKYVFQVNDEPRPKDAPTPPADAAPPTSDRRARVARPDLIPKNTSTPMAIGTTSERATPENTAPPPRPDVATTTSPPRAATAAARRPPDGETPNEVPTETITEIVKTIPERAPETRDPPAGDATTTTLPPKTWAAAVAAVTPAGEPFDVRANIDMEYAHQAILVPRDPTTTAVVGERPKIADTPPPGAKPPSGAVRRPGTSQRSHTNAPSPRAEREVHRVHSHVIIQGLVIKATTPDPPAPDAWTTTDTLTGRPSNTRNRSLPNETRDFSLLWLTIATLVTVALLGPWTANDLVAAALTIAAITNPFTSSEATTNEPSMDRTSRRRRRTARRRSAREAAAQERDALDALIKEFRERDAYHITERVVNIDVRYAYFTVPATGHADAYVNAPAHAATTAPVTTVVTVTDSDSEDDMPGLIDTSSDDESEPEDERPAYAGAGASAPTPTTAPDTGPGSESDSEDAMPDLIYDDTPSDSESEPEDERPAYAGAGASAPAPTTAPGTGPGSESDSEDSMPDLIYDETSSDSESEPEVHETATIARRLRRARRADAYDGVPALAATAAPDTSWPEPSSPSSVVALIDSGSHCHCLRGPALERPIGPPYAVEPPDRRVLVDAGLQRHEVLAVQDVALRCTYHKTPFEITNSIVDTFCWPVLSLRMLERDGFDIDLCSRPPRATAPWPSYPPRAVAIIAKNNMFFMELEAIPMDEPLPPYGAVERRHPELDGLAAASMSMEDLIFGPEHDATIIDLTNDDDSEHAIHGPPETASEPYDPLGSRRTRVTPPSSPIPIPPYDPSALAINLEDDETDGGDATERASLTSEDLAGLDDPVGELWHPLLAAQSEDAAKAASDGTIMALVDTGASGHRLTIGRPVGPLRKALGTPAEPHGFVDVGGRRHPNRGVRDIAVQCVRTGTRFTVTNNEAETMRLPLLSFGALLDAGFRPDLLGSPPSILTPDGDRIAVITRGNHYFVHLRADYQADFHDDDHEPAEMAAAPAAPPVEVAEAFAGVGSHPRSLAAEGARIVWLLECADAKRDILKGEFPDAKLVRDAHDKRAASGTLPFTEDAPTMFGGGFPCKHVAPNGPQQGLQSRHAMYMQYFADRLRTSGAILGYFENVYALLTMGVLRDLDEQLAASDAPGDPYVRILPEGVREVEYIDSTYLKSPVDRSRIHGVYVPTRLVDLAPALPAVKDAGTYTSPMNIGDYLDEDSEEHDFCPGDFVRLAKPFRLTGRARGALCVANMLIRPTHPVGRASLITVIGQDGNWIVRTRMRDTLEIVRDDRRRPTQAVIPMDDVDSHVEHRLPVISPRGPMISPRCRGDVTANSIVEHPKFPGRGRFIRAREAARAMGVPYLDHHTDAEVQVATGDAIEKATSAAIARRDHAYALALHAAFVGSNAVVAPTLSCTPLPPPLLRPLANDDAPAKTMQNLPLDSQTLHETFAHMPAEHVRATRRAYRLPGRSPVTPCRFCTVTNMDVAPTYRTSRNAMYKIPRKCAEADVVTFPEVERLGGRYALVVIIDTGRDDEGRDKPNYVWAKALRHKHDVCGKGPGTPCAIDDLQSQLRLHGEGILSLATDCGGEFVSDHSDAVYRRNQIQHRPRAPDQHADKAENAVKLLVRAVRVMLHSANAPTRLWGDALVTYVAARNARIEPKTGISAHEAMFGHKPDISALAPFWSIVGVYDNAQKKKLDKRGTPARYAGPAGGTVGAITVFVRRNARTVRRACWLARPQDRFDESTLDLADDPPDGSVGDGGPDLSDEGTHADGTPEGADDDDTSSDDERDAPQPRPRRQRTPRDFYTDTRDVPDGKWTSVAGSVVDGAAMTMHDVGGVLHEVDRNTRTGSAFRGASPRPGVGFHAIGGAPREESGAWSWIGPGPLSNTACRDAYREQVRRTRFDQYRACAATTELASGIPANARPLHAPMPPAMHGLEPMSLRKALALPGRARWIAAVSKEEMTEPDNYADRIPAMIRVPRGDVAAGADVCNSIMVCCYKRPDEHGMQKEKARWVLDQSRNMGYERSPANSSPTCLASTLFLCLAIACQYGWEISQFDVTGAYLLAAPSHLMYARYPSGWRDFLVAKYGTPPYEPDDFLLRVNRNVYGANDAGRIWFDLISGVLMEELDFRRCQIDRCCFLKVEGEQRVVLILYVDDLLVIGTEPLRTQIVSRIRDRFPVTEGGADYLGMHILHDTQHNVLKVTQTQFALAVCRKWGYHDAKPAATPLPTGFVATSTPESLSAAQPIADGAAAGIDMKSFAGQIGYLATRTMPHLLYAFCKLAEAAQPSKACPDAPTPFHKSVAARTLRWLRHNTHLGLRFRRVNEFSLDGHVDASFGREARPEQGFTSGSRSGVDIIACGAAVSCASASQGATSISTAQAELNALVLGMRTLVALRRLAEFLIGERLPTSTLHCDNMSVVLMLQRRDLKPTMRHVAVGLGFIYDTIDSGEVIVRHIRTARNPANTFTMAESRDRFAQSVSTLCGQKHVWTPASSRGSEPQSTETDARPDADETGATPPLATPVKAATAGDGPSPCSVIATGPASHIAITPNRGDLVTGKENADPDVPAQRDTADSPVPSDDRHVAGAVAVARRRCNVGDVHI